MSGVYLTIDEPGKIMRRYAMLPLLLVLGYSAASHAQSSHEIAADQAKCSGYGYQQGTDTFASCMMKLDSKRQDRADSEKQSDADMKALSIRRNGNTKFPVCGAAMMDANLDTSNNAWYGPNCREK